MTTEPIDTSSSQLTNMRELEESRSKLDAFLATRIGRFVKFGVVGGSGVVVNLGVFWIFFTLLATSESLAEGTRHTLANGAGVIVSIFTNFLLNDSWTWGDRIKGSRKDWAKRLARYYLSCSIAAGVQILTASLTYSMILSKFELALFGVELGPTLAVLVGIACGIAINFPISHLWAFKDADAQDDAAAD
ncbi:MAG: GtrA family protein [Myxococcota bacterium]|jgi:putative flippase GtrA|nr:GtrA family protein [Myxococcota bacterium]MEC9442430.1 GtrA family protein [Myxococcota bacterium]